MWLQSQEDQELSAAATAHQLILKMTCEHQTVDHRNKPWGTIPTRFLFDFTQYVAQEQTNFENSAEKANVLAQTLD
jgi:hypothetical protein